MNKFYISLFLIGFAVLSACTTTNNNIDIVESEDSSENTMFMATKSNVKSWKEQMQKPDLNDMENFDSLISGYTSDREMNYVITKEDADLLNYYIDDGLTAYIDVAGDIGERHQLSGEKIESGMNVLLTGTYNFPRKLKLDANDISVLSGKGWTIIPIDKLDIFQYPQYEYTSYDEEEKDSIVYDNSSEERINLYRIIGGYKAIYNRNPQNTILITNDLLLHSFHKLFDNTLKYYEQNIARKELSDLSKTLFQKFARLSQSTTDDELKEIYEFLATYRAIPSILLADPEMLKVPQYNSDYGFIENYNPTDEQIRGIITTGDNINQYFDYLDKYSQNSITEILDKIFEAKKIEPDSFLVNYSPDFILMNGITQDYTQFAPRSHYTDNAELKTYFMAMKWLMREKFYFGDKKLAKTAMIMVSQITPEEQSQLSDLSEKIKKLIGGDDDLTLTSLSEWMTANNFSTAEDVINNFTPDVAEKLIKLVPQKIQSTQYSTDDVMSVDSDETKDMTAGFVFFGEKFTLDSYLFDLETAGSAEKESQYMPNKQTAFIVPEILENNSDAAELVNIWMTSKTAKGEIIENKDYTQFSSYDNVKSNAIENVKKELDNSAVISSLYHKRLSMLGYLINPSEENAPYFKLDPIYRLKNLITYMGSYTELKHDTLLYVKQSYAELGGGDEGVEVEPPALSVPKGYIEADLDVINQIVELNKDLQNDFSELDENILSNFIEFDEFLNHMKNILIQQMDNEIISDEDFERMRTAYNELGKIIYPLDDEVSQKEMRGALIADIFTSEGGNPLYEAIGRPAVMLVMIADANGKRIARGPVFTHYEFYDSDDVIDSDSRLNDIQRQSVYDNLTGSKLKSALSIASKRLQKGLVPGN